MGLTSDEKAFPRGGRKPAVGLPKKGNFNLFRKIPKKKKNTSDKPTAKSTIKKFSAKSNLKLQHVKPLTKKALNEGMLILGCIYDIHEYDLTVALPGRLSGKVAVTNISESYTNSLKNLMGKNSAEHDYWSKEHMRNLKYKQIEKSVVAYHFWTENRDIKKKVELLTAVEGPVDWEKIYIYKHKDHLMNFDIPKEENINFKFIKVSPEGTLLLILCNNHLSHQSSTAEDEDNISLKPVPYIFKKIPQLVDMFKIGQFVVAKVLEINEDKVSLSLAPHVVQSDLISSVITEGTVIVAAVYSIEEHGYIMDIGLKNVRAFLKKSSAQKYEDTWNNGKPLGVGQVIRCMVLKADIAFVKLSADPDKVCESEFNVKKLNLDMLIPGTLLKARIIKVIEDGLEVEFGSNFTGYIHRHHFASPWDVPEKYTVGQVHLARVLYIVPMVKLVYLSLKSNICGPEPLSIPSHFCNIGDVKKAKVTHVSNNGIELKLDKETGIKGFVPLHHCDLPQYDDSSSLLHELSEKFKVGSKHKCRLLHFNFMEQFFICSLKKELLTVQYLQPSDFKVSSKVMCRIEKHDKNSTLVSVDGKGRIFFAHVPSLHLGNVPLSHPEKKFPPGSLHKGRILSVADNKIFVTLKSALVFTDVEPLSSFEDFKRGVQCMGTIVLIRNNGLLVTFFGDIKGWIKLGKQASEDKRPEYYLGQLITCYVVRADKTNKKIYLSLNPVGVEERESDGYEVGQMYSVTVVGCTETAVEVHGDAGPGIIPSQHLTDVPTMAPHLLKTYVPGDSLNVYYFMNTQPAIFTVRPSLIHYFKSTENADRNSVKEGTIMPCTVQTVSPEGITLRLPLSRSNMQFVRIKNLAHIKVKNPRYLGLQKHQGLLIKVKKVKKPKYVKVTANLHECWDYTTEHCLSLIRNYWENYDRIAAYRKQLKDPIVFFSPGEQVQGKVLSMEDCKVVLQLKGDVNGIASTDLCRKNLKPGCEATGTVLFVDFINNCVELALHPAVMKRINTIQDGKLDGGLGIGVGVRGEVLSIHPEMVVVVLKAVGREQLAYIPTRCHENDLLPDLNRYKVGTISKLVVEGMENGRIFCVLQRFTFELIKLKACIAVNGKKGKKRTHDKAFDNDFSSNSKDGNSDSENIPKSKKPKLNRPSKSVQKGDNEVLETPESIQEDDDEEEEEDNDNEEEESDNDDDESRMLKKIEIEALSSFDSKDLGGFRCKGKSDSDSDSLLEVNTSDLTVAETTTTLVKKQKCKDSTKSSEEKERLSLSAGFIWDAHPSLLPAAMTSDIKSEGSSSDEEETEKRQHKKKLTPAERRERAWQEEERIRALEKQYLDAEREPQTADEFDRLVLASPNSSMCWIKYMAFHLQATEIEKAKAVGQKALNTISFREEQEKLNVWCALLNLENLYGTKESLDKVLQDAVRMNDELKIYRQMLKIYADSNKVQEAEHLTSLLTKKFKVNKEIWLQCSEVLMKLGQLEKARPLLQKALASLDKKLHIEFIAKFAHLENRLGERERAQTLMEHILTSYPKRVDIWCSYVDMLVKSNQLDSARNVLERAVIQKLPVRKMKTLFSKFLRFEELHGTPEGVERIRNMAKEYVEVTSTATGVDEDQECVERK